MFFHMFKSIHGGAWGFKMLSKNTCEGVHLIIKLPAISLQAYKFTKNEFLHTYFAGGASFLSRGCTPWGGTSDLMGRVSKKIVGWGARPYASHLTPVVGS